MVALAIQPELKIALGSFGGLSVDQARLIVVKPATDTVASQTFTFSPDSTQLTASVSVPITDTATFWVTIQLLDGNTLLFCGADTQLVKAGLPAAGTSPVVLQYCGPGLNVASIQISPRDSGVSFGGSLQYRITGVDSSAAPDSLFYTAWSTGAGNTINANGLFRAGNTRGKVWVYAHTPTGIKDSTSVTVSPVPSQVQIVSGNNQTGVIGTILPQPLVVKVLASDNLPVSGVTVQFTPSSGSANPPTAMTDTAGLAQTVMTLGNTAGTVQVSAKVGTVASASFAETATQQAGVPASLTKVAGDAQSAGVGTAVAVAPQVKVADGFGTPVSGVSVTFAVASGGGSITGPSATTNSSGLASVGSWTLGPTAGANTLTATVTGLPPVTFTATGTGAGAISLSVPGGLVGIGAANLAVIKLTPAAPAGGVTVTVTSDSTQYVTVASPGTIAFAAGDTVKGIAVTGVAVGATVLHATASGYTAGVSAAVATPNFITLTAPLTLGIGRSATVGITLSQPAPSPYLVVALGFGSDTSKIKFVRGSVANPLVGIYSDTIAAGLTSSSVTMEGIGAGLTALTAVSSSYAYTATVVTVNAFPGTLSLVSGGGQTVGVDSLLPQPITVKVDSAGVPVSGYLVNFAVVPGAGSVAPTGITTDATGQASTNWTLGPTVGSQSLTATALGASGSPLTVTATATGSAIASTTVTPKQGTITAINGTVTLVAQAKNASGGNVTGSFTWTSRNTAIASVSTAGVVKGLANGSTWVVATEAGGTQDSAQIVVQQTLASITVTPANRSLYLGTSFNYTATAVDGLGTPLPSNPAFTWSTTAPAVATVDTANHGAVDTVNAIGLGTAQIKATSGAITGVGNLSVLTAITRIAVAVDSGGATKNDTASLPSLGVTRRYHAYAYDTLNVLMPSVTLFAWASSNPSVANVPNETSDTATATSAANGVTAVKATAQGFTSNPGASLTVSQVLASIKLTPDTATVGIGGTAPLTARGLDANAHYISGGAFGFVASNPNIATVGATSGVVTGVAIGSDTVTADSGALVSNPAVIVVSNSVPKAISFGRDTVSVGRGSSASIPILLSTPVPVGTGGLTINLGVSPAAYAHWSTTSVSIPVGGTSVNATLVGDSAGTTTVTATDTSVLGYATASAVAKVTAKMGLTSSYYNINATDIVTTQVLLSDPSPAGGTYVTFAYGTPGIASVSPNPAYIPAGQLAADIQINALAAGTTTITPNAIGVNGTYSTFVANAPVLNLYPAPYSLLGLGQYYTNAEVYVPTYANVALQVTLTNSDTTVVTVPPAVTISANSIVAYFNVTSRGLGWAKITPSAPGWTAGYTDSVIVTTPHVRACCNNTLYTTSGTQSLTVYSADSTGTTHYRTNSLLVSIRSTDTTVMKVIDTTIVIAPNTYYAYPRVTPGALGGSAYVVASASGHTPDSVLYTVNGPPLYLSCCNRLIGVGEEDINGVYVSVPNYVASPLVVKLSNTDPTKVGMPDSVIIPTGNSIVYFTVQGLALGTDTIGATASGYQAASSITYTVTSPAIILNNTNYTFNNFNAGSNFYVYSADSARGVHSRIAPDTISIIVRDTSVAKVDSASVIIPAGQYYNYSRRVIPSDTGNTYVVLNAVGQLVLDSLHVTVNTPPVQIYPSGYPTLLGRRQHMSPSGYGFEIYTPDSRSVAVPVTVTQQHSGVDSLATLTPTIPVSSNYIYVDAFGLANGTDTLTVSATGYNSGNPAYVTVSTPRLTASGLPSSTTTTNPPIGLNVWAADSVGTSHYTMDTVTVRAVSSDSTVIKPESTYYHIPKNSYYTQVRVDVVGPDTASITFSDSANSGYQPWTTNVITVTGPSLGLYPSSVVLGMRQTTGPNGVEVYTTNSVTSPLVVHLQSTDTLVVTVPDSVIIPSGTNYIYFPVTAKDTLGTIQIKATATGYSLAAMSAQSTRPKFAIYTSSQLNTTSGRSTITVYPEDQNGTTHYTTDSVIVHLQSSATGVANIDSATVTIPIGQNYNNHATWGPASLTTPGTAQLTATDTTAALYAYQQATYNVTVVTPSLNLGYGTSVLGIGQYNNQYVYTPDNAASPIAVSLAHNGTARTSTMVNGTAVSTVTIPAASNIVYFHQVGTAVGWDTLVATTTSPPENPATSYTAVSQGHVDPIQSWPSTLSLSGTDSVQIVMYSRDSTGGTHPLQDSTTFTLAPNAFIQFTANGGIGAITSIVIPKDQYYVYLWVKGLAQGAGQATISATNYVTYQTPAITVSP